MNYEEELRSKLDAVRPVSKAIEENIVDVGSRERVIFGELEEAFEAPYDLDESDLLRTLKILAILDTYPNVFKHSEALRLFYTLTQVDIVTPKSLLIFSRLPTAEFKTIIHAMAGAGLLFINSDGELELTMEGKSLAARIGVESYL